MASTAVTALAAADLDSDGFADLVLGTATGTQLLINRGTAGGFKDATPIETTAAATTAIVLANVDTDRDLDLLVATAAGVRLVRNAPVQLTRLAFVNVEVALTATGSTDLITINNGNGAFLLTAEGIAGQFSGDVKAGPAGFSVGASMSARINTTTRTFDETIELGGTTIAIKFVAGEVASGTPLKPWVKFTGKVAAKFGPVEISGTLTAGSGGTQYGTVDIFIGVGPGLLDDGTVNPNARGIFLRGAKFIHKDTGNGTFALYAEGTLELLGIPGVTLAAQQVTVTYNTGHRRGRHRHPGLPDQDRRRRASCRSRGTLVVAFSGLELSGAFTLQDGRDQGRPRDRPDRRQARARRGARGRHHHGHAAQHGHGRRRHASAAASS